MLAGGPLLALGGTAAVALGGRGNGAKFGLIGKPRAVAGQRNALIVLLLEGTGEMPGCLSYIVVTDSEDADAIWVTEVWDRQESHQASSQFLALRSVIPRARPLIAGFDNRHETEPVGGIGQPRAAAGPASSGAGSAPRSG